MHKNRTRRRYRSSRKSGKVTAAHEPFASRRQWGFELLEERRLLDGELGGVAFVALINRINEQLGTYQTEMTSAVSSSTAALPVVGKTAKDLLGAVDSPAGVSNVNAVVNAMRNKLSQLSSSIQSQGATTYAGTAVQDLIFGAIGTYLGDNDADADSTVSASDVKLVEFHPDNGTVIVDVNLRADATFAQDFRFGLGLPGFPLEVSSGGELNFGITLGIDHIKFGISNSTPFVDVASSHSVGLQLHTGVSNGEFNALFGFLQIHNRPGDEVNLGLTGTLAFDLGASGISNPMFNVVAHAYIPFETVPKSILTDDLQMPQVRGNLVFDWTIVDGANESIDAFGEAPHVQLNDVSFQVGGLMQYIVGPMVKYMRYAMAPQQIFIGAVTQPIPGFSEIWQQVFNRDLTILEIANALSSAGVIPAPYNFVIDAVNIMKDITNSVSALTDDSLFSADIFDTYMPLGSIDFSKVAGQVNSLHDLRGDPAKWQPGEMAEWLNDPLHVSTPLTALAPYAQATGRTIEQALADNVPQSVQELSGYQDAIGLFHDRLASMNSGISLSFPLLQDPIGSVFKLFAGQNFQLVDFSIRMDAKRFDRDNPMDLSVDEFPVPTPVRFTGDMTMDFYVHMGYDTVGLRKALSGDPFGMFDGFNFDLRDPDNLSQTRPLLKFDGQLNASLVAGIDLGPFAGAGAELTGFIKADNVKVNIVDEDRDGFFRPFNDFNPSGALFGLQGKVSAGVQAGFYVSTLLTGKDYLIGPITFGEIPIFDLSPGHQSIDNHNVYPELLKEARLKVKIKPRISISDAMVMEGKDGTRMAKFTVSMNIPTEDEVRVQYSTQVSDKASADDIGAVAGELVFAPNELKKTIEVPIIGDTRMEENETFAVRLSNATNGVIVDDYGTGTIIDEDTEAIFTTPTGPIDVDFANNGYIRFQAPLSQPSSAPGNLAGELIYDSNGRLIVIQDALALNAGQDESFMALRYLPNGQLDSYFGGDGVAALTVGGIRVYGRKGAVYQSGSNRDKVLIIGNKFLFGDSSMMAARFNIDGTPDTSFGNQGYVYFGPNQEAMSVAIYESGPNAGKVLVGAASGGTITVTRLAADGSLDPTFGSNGRVQFQTPAGTYSFAAGAISVKAATDSAPEKIVVFTGAALPGVLDGVATQLNADGSLDTTFGANGSTTLVLNNVPVVFTPNDMTVQSDGKILVAGSQNMYGCTLARLNADGSLDTTFANNGYFKYDAYRVSSHGISLTPDGKIVIVGEFDGDFMTIRLNSNGTFDSTFDPISGDGVLTANIGQAVGTGDHARAVVADAEGNIVVGGSYAGYNESPHFAALKYEGARNDLSIVATADTSRALNDRQIVYTIRVKNTGTDAAFASIKDILPANTKLVSLVAPSSWITNADGMVGSEVIAATRSLKESDGEQILVLTVEILGEQPVPASFANSIQAASAIVDTNSANNILTLNSAVEQNLSIEALSTHINLVATNTLVQFAFCVTNDGPRASQFKVSTAVPAGSEFVSATGSYTLNNGVITWDVDTLEGGAIARRDFVVRALIPGFLQATGSVAGVVNDQSPTDNVATSLTTNVPTGVVSYWKADTQGPGGTIRDSVGNNHGTLVNNATLGQGYSGQAFQLAYANQQYVNIPDSTSLESQDFTISVRFTANSMQQLPTLVSKTVGNGFLDSYSIWFQNGGINAIVSSNNDYRYVSIPLVPTAGVWYQAAMSMSDAGALKLYLIGPAGVQVAETTVPFDVAFDDHPFRIGMDIENASPAYFWDGKIDEVYFFNKVLTQNEIANLDYSRTIDVPNLVPTVGADSLSVTVRGGNLATNTGSFADLDGDAHCMFLSASHGTVVVDPSNPAKWLWNYMPQDIEPIHPVTITFNDGRGGIATRTFDFTATLPGDFGSFGVVDSRSYVLWRKNPAQFGGDVGYDEWRRNVGRVVSPGAAAEYPTGASAIEGFAPEPAPLVQSLANENADRSESINTLPVGKLATDQPFDAVALAAGPSAGSKNQIQFPSHYFSTSQNKPLLSLLLMRFQDYRDPFAFASFDETGFDVVNANEPDELESTFDLAFESIGMQRSSLVGARGHRVFR